MTYRVVLWGTGNVGRPQPTVLFDVMGFGRPMDETPLLPPSPLTAACWLYGGACIVRAS
jgi:hypothetical protein